MIIFFLIVIVVIMGMPVFFWWIQRPVYCTLCGKKLIHQKVENGYNNVTGKKLYKTIIYCTEHQTRGMPPRWM
jgi:hypothetical protein